MMIHDLDIARWVAGEVTQVSATWTRRGDGNHRAEAAHVLLTHASGAITHVAGVWGAAHLRFTTGYFAAGTGGTLEYDRAAEQGFVADLARPARPAARRCRGRTRRRTRTSWPWPTSSALSGTARRPG